METRSRYYLESDVFGTEYFDTEGMSGERFLEIVKDADIATQEDGITRRVGVEIMSADEDQLELWQKDSDERSESW